MRKIKYKNAELLEERIVGEDGAALTETQRVEIAKIKRGQWTTVQWAALINKPDKGTAKQPLASFQGADANEKFRASCAFATHVITIVRPFDAAAAVPFLQRLPDKICPLFGTVPAADLNKWFLALTQHMSKSANKFILGDSGATASANFDKSWLTAANAANTELNEAKLTANGGGRDPKKNKDKRNQEAGDDDRDDSAKKKKSDKDASNKKGDAIFERGPGIQKGAKVNPPARGGTGGPGADEWKSFHAEHPPITDNKGVEKQACWHYFHPQGCSRGIKCSWHHGK